MRDSSFPRPSLRSQRGAALAIALLMLVVLLMLGAAAARLSLQSEKIARSRFARQIAWHAAEAALLDAEYDIGNPDSPRRALFDAMQAAPATGEDAHKTPADQNRNGELPPGLYFPGTGSQNPLWRGLGTGKNVLGVRYGSFTAHVMQTGAGLLPARLPRYLIEILPRTANQPAEDRSMRFRISAVGFGPDAHSGVLLQSVYRRAPTAGKADKSGAVSKRLSWREIPAENAP